MSLQAATIALLVLAIHLVALDGAFVWDDADAISESRLIHSPRGLRDFWLSTEQPDYWPVSYTVLWFEWRLFGREPAGYRAVNLALHAVNALLVWRLLTRLRVPGAWLCGLLFAVHPVTVEAIDWIIQIKTLLSTMFALLTLILFLRYDAAGRPGWLVAAWLAFLLALLAKSAVVTLPFVMLVVMWWMKGRLARRDVVRVLPFFALSLALGAVGVWFQSHNAIGSDIVRDDSFWSRLAVAGRAVWFYAAKAVLPVNLSFVYWRWELPAVGLLAWLPTLALAIVFFLAWRRRAGWGRSWLVGLGCYVLALFPALGFANIYFMRYSLVADHWQYLALPALIALAVGSVNWLFERYTPARTWIPAASGLATILIFSLLSFQRALVYAAPDNELLWRDAIAKNPRAWLSHDNLAMILWQKGRLPEAQAELDCALSAAIRFSNWDAAAFAKLANTRSEFGSPSIAAVQFARTAVEKNPDRPEWRLALAATLAANQAFPAAIDQARRAIALKPAEWRFYINVGTLLANAGSLADARHAYLEALRLKPDCADAHYNLGNVLIRLGDSEGATQHLRAACAANPYFAEPKIMLASVLSQKGQADEAIQLFREAIELGWADPVVHNNLGVLLARQGNRKQAAEQFSAALRLRPDYAEARRNLEAVEK